MRLAAGPAAHQTLLAGWGYGATTVVLLLSVSGTICKDTLRAMHAHLGISKQQAARP